MNEERFYELTAKFLSREITIHEQNELTVLLQIDSYNKQFEIIVEKWNNEKRDLINFDENSGLEKLTDRLIKKDSSFKWNDNLKARPHVIFNPYFQKIAASIILILGVVFIILYLNGYLQNDEDFAWIEAKTLRGQTKTFELSDHSKVTLNAESKLRYPSKFNGKNREVHLEGEAYFEVSHDKSKSFIVHSGKLATTVLGTKFNVGAFPNDKTISVSLVEGSVKITKNEEGKMHDVVLLKPSQQLVYSKEYGTSSVDNFDLLEVVGWKDGILKFNDRPMSDVLIQLGRYFGVSLELKNNSLAARKITANFHGESLDNILAALSKLTDLRYESVTSNGEKHVILY